MLLDSSRPGLCGERSTENYGSCWNRPDCRGLLPLYAYSGICAYGEDSWCGSWCIGDGCRICSCVLCVAKDYPMDYAGNAVRFYPSFSCSCNMESTDALNVKDGIIQEALVETIGCSGMTHSAAMASEILPGKTILEALNTDLVCDAINTAMRELFKQIVYGRTQSAFSEGGLVIGASLEDLGKGLRSQVGTMFGTLAKGARYLEMAEGYCTRMGLDANDEIIGYEFVHLGKFMDFVKKGIDPKWHNARGKSAPYAHEGN